MEADSNAGLFHLEGAQAELDEDAGLGARVLGQDGEQHVVHPEERDEQQRGLGQPPGRTGPQRETPRPPAAPPPPVRRGCSPEVAGVVPAHAGRPQLLHQDADHVDEDEEVHLPMKGQRGELVNGQIELEVEMEALKAVQSCCRCEQEHRLKTACNLETRARLTSRDAVMGARMIHQMKATSVSSQHLGQTETGPISGERPSSQPGRRR